LHEMTYKLQFNVFSVLYVMYVNPPIPILTF